MAAAQTRSICIALALLVAGGGCSSLPWPPSDSASLVSKLKRASSTGNPDGRFAWFKGLTGRGNKNPPIFGNDSLTAPPFVSPLAPEKGTLAKLGDAVNNSRLVKGAKRTLKKGTEKVASIGKSNISGASDVISLSEPLSDPNADLYVSIARLQETKGNVVRAEDGYREALEVDPQNLKALSGLARLFDRLGRLEEATKLYLKATRHHHKEPGAFNDLALCYAKQGKLEESVTALTHAIELQPYRKLYRNNIATVLVEAGREDQALQHLVAVHGEAIAQYNLGYLLKQKGLEQQASLHFAKAVEIDPSFNEARQWYELTSGQSGPRIAGDRAASPTPGVVTTNPPSASPRRPDGPARDNQPTPSPGGVTANLRQPYGGRAPAPGHTGSAGVRPLGSQYSAPSAGTRDLGSLYTNRSAARPGSGSPNHSQRAPIHETVSGAPLPTSSNTQLLPQTQSRLAPRHTAAVPPVPNRVEPPMPVSPESDPETTPTLGARKFDPPPFPMPQGASSPPGVRAPEIQPSSTYYPASRY